MRDTFPQFKREREVALAYARELDSWHGEHLDMEERALRLCTTAQEFGAFLECHVKVFGGGSDDLPVAVTPSVRFHLRKVTNLKMSGLAAIALSKSLATREKFLKPIARVVANMVDGEYLIGNI